MIPLMQRVRVFVVENTLPAFAFDRDLSAIYIDSTLSLLMDQSLISLSHMLFHEFEVHLLGAVLTAGLFLLMILYIYRNKSSPNSRANRLFEAEK